MGYGGKAVAEAEIVAGWRCPLEETWLDKFKGTVPDPVKYNCLNQLNKHDLKSNP
jgi:hypothetical protein